MAETKKSSNDKTRRVLNIIFACIAIIAAVATVLLSPFGKRLLNKNETTTTETQIHTASSVNTTKPVITESSQSNTDITEAVDSTSVSIPPSTNPVADIYKNYSIFIDKRTFDFTENGGTTTLVAKKNNKVSLTVTPHKDITYTELCVEAKKSYTQLSADKKLKIDNLNTAFSSQAGDIVTTVYCIDDGRGGSIELKYQLPTGDKEYVDDINLILSMFTIN